MNRTYILIFCILIYKKITKLNICIMSTIINSKIQLVEQHCLCLKTKKKKKKDKLCLPFSLRRLIRSRCFISISPYFLILCAQITFLIKIKLNHNSFQAKIHIHIKKHDLHYNQNSSHIQSKKMRVKGFAHWIILEIIIQNINQYIQRVLNIHFKYQPKLSGN